jgi:hypothetical protein
MAATITVRETYRWYLHSQEGSYYSQIRGSLTDGPAPQIHDISMEQGRCRYLSFEAAFCKPPCSWNEYCSQAGTCEPYPNGIWGGTLTITGLAVPIEIPPEAMEGTYYGPYPLPDDLFDVGAAVTAELTGDTFPATTWHAAGVQPMDEGFAEQPFAMIDGQDAVVTWTPGSDPDVCVEVWINGTTMSSMAHGMPLDDIIWCVGPDSGTLTIPQALVQEFPLGETPENECFGFDCPKSELIRVSRDVVSSPEGPAELAVSSTVYFRYHHTEQ